MSCQVYSRVGSQVVPAFDKTLIYHWITFYLLMIKSIHDFKVIQKDIDLLMKWFTAIFISKCVHTFKELIFFLLHFAIMIVLELSNTFLELVTCVTCIILISFIICDTQSGTIENISRKWIYGKQKAHSLLTTC